MERYFKLTEETIVNEAGRKLRQIECIRDFKFAHAGELGGFIEKEENLGGEAWVDEGAQVWGEAKVINGSVLRDNARVYGRSKVRNGSVIYDEARVYDYALVAEAFDALAFTRKTTARLIDGRAVYVTAVDFARREVRYSNQNDNPIWVGLDKVTAIV